LLRRTHLDALPQLWNLLRGDLTLVGPRPERSERFESLCALHPCFRLRASVAPGLTGWAQLRAGGAELGEEALSLDLYYLKHRSLTLDLLIVWASAARALRGGVSAS
jgi:lipopolysaccharide/colanic/teichoic acid biosynthesis glycosyltransferase